MKIIKDICKWVVLIGLFAIPFIPFIVPSAMFFPFITGKGFTFRILVEILFGLYAILAVAEPSYRPKLSWISKSIGIFAVVILLADLLGANISKSIWSNYERMEGFVLIFHLVLYYIVASSVLKTPSRFTSLFNTSIFASILMSLYGLSQLTGHTVINQGGVRLDGTFGNASYFAIYLVFHIFLCLYLLVGSEVKKWQKWAYGLVALFETIILYFTATRGAILGLVGGLLLSALLIAWKEKGNKSLKKSAYATLLVIAVGALGFVGLRNTSFVQKSPVLSRFASINKEEITSQGRYYVWPMALKGVAERPILGWGQENFNYVFNKQYDPRMYAQEQWFDRTHDVVLDWLIAGGILGFLSYVGMYVALLYYVWRKESLLTASEKSIFTGMIAAYVFHNIFVFDNLVSYIVFFTLLAYMHSISVLRKSSTHGFNTKAVSQDVTLYVALPIIVVLTVMGVYYINVPALSANKTLIQAISPQQAGGVEKNLALFKEVFEDNSFGIDEATEQLVQVTSQISSSNTVPDTLKKQFYDYASLKIKEKTLRTPNDARYFVFAGTFFNRFGEYDEAIPYLTRALELSPRKQTIYFELGTSYIGKKDYTKAMEILKAGYELAPESGESRVVYAVGALYSKNTTVLQTLTPLISTSTVLNDNRFLKAYADLGDYMSVISILTTRLKTDPNNMNYKFSLASAYVNVGQKQKAIDVLKEMIAQDPTFKDQGEGYIKQIQGL